MIKLKSNSKIKESGKIELKNKIKRVLMKSMFKMEELAIEKAPSDQGELRQKIKVSPEILSDRYALTSGASHSAAIEYGTRPFYAPIKPLKEWAKRKEFVDEKIAYAVQKKIAEYGITASPFMRPALYEVKTFWMNEFAKQEFQNK